MKKNCVKNASVHLFFERTPDGAPNRRPARAPSASKNALMQCTAKKVCKKVYHAYLHAASSLKWLDYVVQFLRSAQLQQPVFLFSTNAQRHEEQSKHVNCAFSNRFFDLTHRDMISSICSVC